MGRDHAAPCPKCGVECGGLNDAPCDCPTEALKNLMAGRPTGVEEPEGGVFAFTPGETPPISAEEQAKRCAENHGLTNCPKISPVCECAGCGGKLGYDSYNIDNTLAFLTCDECGCTYVVERHS